jgi:hypothetical protein
VDNKEMSVRKSGKKGAFKVHLEAKNASAQYLDKCSNSFIIEHP